MALRGTRRVDTLDKYCYSPLAEPSQQIRLLRIISGNTNTSQSRSSKAEWDILPDHQGGYVTGTLTEYNIDDAPPYIAISYVWGAGCATHQMEIAGRELGIRRNAYTAMLKIDKLRPGTFLWIDSVCINQDDKREKMKQVRLMGTIYNTATLVISDIGSHRRDSKALFAISRLRRQGEDPFRTISAEDLRSSLVSFSKREYWTRLWVIQECIAARQLCVMCADEVMPTDDLEWTRTFLDENHHQGLSRMLSHSHMWEILRARKQSDPCLDFEDAMQKFGHWNCGDLRDRIFGLLYFVRWADGRAPLSPDYRMTKEQLATSAFRHCLTAEGVRTVCNLLSLEDHGPRLYLKCCVTLDDVRSMMKKMKIHSLDKLDVARLATRTCSAIGESLAVWAWLSDAVSVHERFQLLTDSVALWPDGSDVRELLLELSVALDLVEANSDIQGLRRMVPEIYEATTFAERSELFLSSLPYVTSNIDVDFVLRILRLPRVDLELAKYLLTGHSRLYDQRVVGGSATIIYPAALLQVLLPLFCEDIGTETRLKLTSAFLRRCLQARYRSTAKEYGAVLQVLGLDTAHRLNIGEGLRLAFAFYHVSQNIGDATTVLDAIVTSSDWTVSGTLRLLLCGTFACAKDLLGFLDALTQRIQSGHPGRNGSDRLARISTMEYYGLLWCPAIDRRLIADSSPGPFDDIHCLTLCQTQCVSARNRWRYNSSDSLAAPLTLPNDFVMLGPLSDIWFVLNPGPGSTPLWRISALRFGGRFGPKSVEEHVDIDHCEIWSCTARLYVSSSDLSVLLATTQTEPGRHTNEQYDRLSGTSWASIDTAAGKMGGNSLAELLSVDGVFSSYKSDSYASSLGRFHGYRDYAIAKRIFERGRPGFCECHQI